MIRLDLKNYNTTLIDNEKKYQFYYQVKYEYFTGEEILPFSQNYLIDQIEFAYFPLVKLIGKQAKTVQDQG